MKYIALLRGINVGGRIIKMADLKACFEKLGFDNISTVLQTGNVIFECNETNTMSLKAMIEKGLTETFDYPAVVFVYSVEYVKRAAEAYPFDSSNEDFQHYVMFFEPGLASNLISSTKADDLNPAVEEVTASGDVVYWQVKKGMTLESTFSKKSLARSDYWKNHTNRNLNTVKKIITLSISSC